MKFIESKRVPIDSIKPNSYNPNVIKGSVYDFLKRSIKKVGFVQPIVVTSDGVIIDGEHRWKACKDNGETEIEVKVLAISESEAKAATINFNMTKGVLDADKLGKMLLEMEREMGGDKLKESLVLEKKKIDNAIKQAIKKERTPIVAVERATETSIVVGDVFELGPHTLRCGDSIKDPLDTAADITLTDPPYNVGFKYGEYIDDKTEKEYMDFVGAYVSRALEISPFVVLTHRIVTGKHQAQESHNQNGKRDLRKIPADLLVFS